MEIKLYLGDAFKWLAELKDGSVNLVLTDPPYLLDTKGHGIMDNCPSLQKNQRSLSAIKDGYDILALAKEVERLQTDINAYFFCSKNQIPQYFKVYVEQMGCKFDLLSWHKTSGVPPFFYGKYLNDTEYCLHFFKGKRTTLPQCYEDAASYYISKNIKSTGEALYDHPTQKPLAFVRRIIRNSSQEGGVVLDPFMGSGTTGEAAIIERRSFIGVEHNANYFTISAQRLHNADSKPKQLSIFD